jgi:uroporphyrinogen decarboxylase
MLQRATKQALETNVQKRDVVRLAIEGRAVPYVPWHCEFTVPALDKLRKHFATEDIHRAIDNHFLKLGSDIGFFTDLGADRFGDYFGVTWDRTVDKDIGIVEGCVLPQPTLANYNFPDPTPGLIFDEIEQKIAANSDCFRVFKIGFSLYERAWTLRGMENLMMDFIANPNFAHDLLDRIADYNIAQVNKALTYDIDAVYFGDDWGQQSGLQMGPALWTQFIKPRLARMYKTVKNANKFVMIHSCGKVDELFNDLIEIGLDCFNPFQPEVMDTFALIKKYHKRLAFHGGLSTQITLPEGTPQDVKKETQKLLDAGKNGSYIFAPAHAVQKDVPLKNILTFIELLKNQQGYSGATL